MLTELVRKKEFLFVEAEVDVRYKFLLFVFLKPYIAQSN